MKQYVLGFKGKARPVFTLVKIMAETRPKVTLGELLVVSEAELKEVQ